MFSSVPPTSQSGSGNPRSAKPKTSPKRRIIIVAIILVIIVAILSLRGTASFYTDYLWFKNLDFTSIWRGILLTKIFLSLIFFGIFMGLLFINFSIAEKISPKSRPSGPEEKALERYYSSILGKKSWIPKVVVSALLALMVGVGAGQQWQNWLLFVNKTKFGIEDQLHNIDIGFYIFQLPFLNYVVGWLFSSVIIIIIFTALYHYLQGGIRFNIKKRKRVTPAVHAHLSILLGVLALIRAVDYFLDRFDLTVSTSGFVNGASYTDVNARLPVLNLLIVIALISTALFIYNIWRRNWIIPAIAVGLWTFVAIVMGNIYPAFIQSFRVNPAESSIERTYIVRNIESTRIATGLNDVTERTLNVDNAKTYAELVSKNLDITNVIPIQDSKRLPQTFENLQGERGFYHFSNPLDVDRYNIDGVLTPVVIGVRELNQKSLPTTSWEASHLAYTHGFGVSLTPANSINAGLPDFRIGGLPIKNSLSNLSLDEPRIYIGELIDDYSIVSTDRKEIDGGDTSSEQGTYTYTGTGGVPIDSFIKRAAFALRFSSINPLISNFITDDSQIIYIRNVRERIQKLAPFLSLDSEVYPVIANNRIYYIVDGYTTTNLYPYAQQIDTAQLDRESGLHHDLNYIRNSVKIVVDSFNGTVNFYVFDETDPILATWRKAFPNLFSNKSEMSKELLDHIRYPEDLFKIQTNVWSSYQLDDPLAFYSRAEAWSVAQDPGGVTGAAFTAATNAQGVVISSEQVRIDPYYSVLRLPQEETQSYVTLRPFVPISTDTRKELTAFMVAKGDPDEYGKLILYRIPGGNVDGPALVNSKIQSDPGISRIITLLDQQGSNVRFGEMLLVPIEDSILYVRSLYVEAASTQVPELQRVVAVLGDSVVMCSTLDESLKALFDASLIASASDSSTDRCVGSISSAGTTPSTTPPSPTPSTTPPTTTTTSKTDNTDDSINTQALELLKQANTALENNDLGLYQDLVDQARNLLAQN